jgi:hypothetical protein
MTRPNAKHERAYYEKNRSAVIARVAAKRQERRELIMAHLLKNPCVDCGETDPIVLDFDHRVPADKCFSVANGISSTKSMEAVVAEIQKCDIRCANCHRRRTAKQFAWWKYRETSDVVPAGPLHPAR